MSPTTSLPTYQVDFEPIGKRVEVPAGTNLLDAAQQAGLGLASACGGIGNCGQCRIVLLTGDVSPPTEDEEFILTDLEREAGQRLACSTRLYSPVKVHVPKESLVTGQRLQLQGEAQAIRLEPLVRAYPVDIPPPTLHDLRADLERVSDSLSDQLQQPLTAEPAVIRQLSPLARQEKWQLTAFVRNAELVGLAPAGSAPLGMAVDLGTTKIAASLVDLATGEELALAGALNPQIGYGEDIVSRLTHARRHPDGGQALAHMVQETLEELLGELVAQAGLNRSQVVDICIVGNTAMTHLLTGLPVDQLAVSPYVAATRAPLDIKARVLGLTTAPGAYVHVLPCIGGFVGADHVAMLLASQFDQTDRVLLGVDIGTNTEIALAKPGGRLLMSASCASGPAFEGAHIADGMRAASGAIERIKLTESGQELATVDDAPAVGLCGSGIVDAVAELWRWKLLNHRGRFQPAHPRVEQGRHGAEFCLVDETHSGTGRRIVISQNDINEIQLAKGAIRAGLEILLEASQTDPAEVDEVIVAGAFGSYLNLQNARAIGLLPDLPQARYRQVGNAAIVGARWALLSRTVRRRAQDLVNQTDYLELTTYPKFNRRFALGMLLPQTG